MVRKYDDERAQPYEVIRTGIKAPSSNWSDIRCPFCKATSRAYWWSLCGSGKRCEGCGAMFNGFGSASPLVSKEKV